jgi:hypothetical protein
MMRTLLLVCSLALPAASQAQSSEAASSSSSLPAPPSAQDSSASTPAAAAQQTSTQEGFFHRGIFAPSVHDAPFMTFTGSYVYQYSPDYVGANRSLMGWSATPTINFSKYLGLQAEFTSLYMSGVYPGQNRLMMAAGPRINLAPHSRFTPFVFGEGGEIRETSQGNNISNWNPVASAGFGINVKLTRGFGFQLIPGQYVGQVHDDGSWTQSFMTKAGFTFNLYK